MLKMFAIVHAQSHNGTKGKMVRGSDGKVIGYSKTEGNATTTNFTKKAQREAARNLNLNRGGNTGTGGTGRG